MDNLVLPQGFIACLVFEAENSLCVYCGYAEKSGGAMIDRYLPVPVWNNRVGRWEPVDFRHGQHVTVWPDRFDLTRLPLPDYRDGDRVQFVRDESCTREGVVRMVLLRGGGYGPLNQVEIV